MIFRLSQKLAKKLKAGTLPDMPLDEHPYADWSCHLFTADHTQYIIVTNTQALYSTGMYGEGLTDDSRFIDRTLHAIREFMEDDGQQFAYRKFIAPASGTVSFSKALNRSLTGSMNELIGEAQMYLVEDEMAPREVGFRLNGILFLALKNAEDRKYAVRRDAFKRLTVGWSQPT